MPCGCGPESGESRDTTVVHGSDTPPMSGDDLRHLVALGVEAHEPGDLGHLRDRIGIRPHDVVKALTVDCY